MYSSVQQGNLISRKPMSCYGRSTYGTSFSANYLIVWFLGHCGHARAKRRQTRKGNDMVDGAYDVITVGGGLGARPLPR
jgi:hypothetical protein